jgi:MFS family permease
VVPKPNDNYQIKSLLVPVFLPSLLFSIGENSLIPLIPASAQAMGADLGTAGLIAGLVMTGTLIADLPAGKLVDRIGERNSMIYSAAAGAAGILLSVFALNLYMLGAGILILGAASAVFALARHSFLTEHIPLSHRARSVSILGGMFRGGSFFGPLLGAWAVHIGGPGAVYWVAVIVCSSAALLLLTTKKDAILNTPVVVAGRTLEVAKREWKKLATVGVGVSVIGILRTSRQIGLPLWAISIGIPPAEAAFYIGVANGLDFALFYASGAIMDRYGRRWAAVPTAVGLAIAHLLVAFSFNSPTFFAIAILMAVVNGVGSGVILVLGSDLSPKDARNEFLASYRLLTDAAVAGAGPLLVGVAALVTLGPAMAIFGWFGFGGAWLLWKYIPRYSPKPVKK